MSVPSEFDNTNGAPAPSIVTASVHPSSVMCFRVSGMPAIENAIDEDSGGAEILVGIQKAANFVRLDVTRDLRVVRCHLRKRSPVAHGGAAGTLGRSHGQLTADAIDECCR